MSIKHFQFKGWGHKCKTHTHTHTCGLHAAFNHSDQISERQRQRDRQMWVAITESYRCTSLSVCLHLSAHAVLRQWDAYRHRSSGTPASSTYPHAFPRCLILTQPSAARDPSLCLCVCVCVCVCVCGNWSMLGWAITDEAPPTSLGGGGQGEEPRTWAVFRMEY